MLRNALLALFFIIAFVSPLCAQDTITLNTEEYYPYNYSENGVIKGTSTQIVEHIFKKRKFPIASPSGLGFRGTTTRCLKITIALIRRFVVKKGSLYLNGSCLLRA